MKSREAIPWWGVVLILTTLALFAATFAQADEPAPGTPESIRATLVRATEMGVTFTPTRINQTTQMRESCCAKQVPRFKERRQSAPTPANVQPAPVVLRRASFVCTRSQEAGGR